MSDVIMSGGSPEFLLKAGKPVLEHFGVEANATTQPGEFLAAIAQLNPRFKGARDLVRWQLEEDQTQWPEETKLLLFDFAEKTRMLATDTPLVGHFAVVGVLGAARKAPLDRWNYAADAITQGRATADMLIGVGSARKLGDPEKESTSNYAPGAVEEYDLVKAARRIVAKAHPSLQARRLRVNNERAGNDEVMQAVLRRAKRQGVLHKGARVAAVTTQIYQPAAALDLARIAKRFGITDTLVAGNPSDIGIVQKRTVATYLSEALRTMRAAVEYQVEA